MKRFLVVIPIFLLLVLNSCGELPGTVSPQDGTAVGQTQTASVWTPTFTASPDPPENRIVEWLNAELSKVDQPEDELEKTLDAHYLVTGVSFPNAPGSSAQIFRVDLRCECSSSSNCCVPERMFVVLMKAMKGNDKIAKNVPSNVGAIKVLCYDHIVQNFVIGADWTSVKGYIEGNVSGYELGAQVYRTTFP
ncbi:MAG: hypothetical protein QM730_02290 [Anaerolineales bacterium]